MIANKKHQPNLDILLLKIRRISFIFFISIVICVIIISVQALWSKYEYKQFIKRQRTAIINPVKVFQIGFSKCGTSSLYSFFNNSGIPSVHHDNGFLANSIHVNYHNKLPLISGRYSKILVFTDMEVLYKTPQVMVGMQYFKELDKQYPGSKFILNTRNKEAWLKSRSLQTIHPSGDTLLKISAEILKLTEEEMLEQWSHEWDEHYRDVLEYFKKRPNDLLVFNIEKDNPEKIKSFFKDNFNLDTRYYKKKNQTAFRGLRERWNAWFYPQSVKIVLMDSVKIRPVVGQ